MGHPPPVLKSLISTAWSSMLIIESFRSSDEAHTVTSGNVLHCGDTEDLAFFAFQCRKQRRPRGVQCREIAPAASHRSILAAASLAANGRTEARVSVAATSLPSSETGSIPADLRYLTSVSFALPFTWRAARIGDSAPDAYCGELANARNSTQAFGPRRL